MLLVALGQVLKSKDTSYPQQPSPGISERTGCSGPRVASWDLGMLAQQGKRERKQHFKTKQKPNTEREQLRSHFPHHHHNFWKLWYHFCRKSNEVSLLNHHKDDDHIMEVTPQKSIAEWREDQHQSTPAVLTPAPPFSDQSFSSHPVSLMTFSFIV